MSRLWRAPAVKRRVAGVNGGGLVRMWAEPGVSNRPLDVLLCGYQIARMTARKDDQITRPVPRTLTEVLDASVRDIAAGHVGAAAAPQHEARRMLAEFEKARSGAGAAPVGKGGTGAKTA
jgi:hypothetical protein